MSRERIHRYDDIPPRHNEVTVENMHVVTRILVYSTNPYKLRRIKEDIRDRKEQSKGYYIAPEVR